MKQLTVIVHGWSDCSDSFVQMKKFLQSQGIPCEVEGPSAGTPLPENLGAFGMSRIMVPAERSAEAGQLLASRGGERESGSGEE